MDNHHNNNLTRRATATDEDFLELLKSQSSQSEDGATSASPLADLSDKPDTSHKRKQSDIAFDKLNIGSRTNFELEKIEQGVEEDEDHDYYALHSPPSSMAYNIMNNGCPLSSQTRLIFSSYPIKNARFVAAFVFLASVAFVGFLRSSKSTDDWGFEVVGEGFATNSVSDWLEFYPSPERMPKMISTGPQRVDDTLGGMHLFTDVCVTNNIDDTSLRGLIFFDKRMAKNPKRCVPCSTRGMNAREEDIWGEMSSVDTALGHQCGFKGVHASYATSVTDWNECMAETNNHQLLIRNKQTQSPSYAKNVHYFQEPTLLLSFKENDRESSLFDSLFTYLPYWSVFRKDGYPFERVFSKSVQGCLSHSRNWFCELTHQMGAFGYAKEVMWEPTHATLYCFKSLYVNQLEYQRSLSHPMQITKHIMDEFRDEIFSHFGLPRPRDRKEMIERDKKLAMRIVLYANNESSDKNRWEGLDKLVDNSKRKHPHVEFYIIHDFDVPIAEQARLFNSADAIVMATGDHFANSIFVPDDTIFAELSCSSRSPTNNPRFMELISGSAINVSSSTSSECSESICISCMEDQSSFTMSDKSFQSLVDDIVEKHSAITSVIRDGRRLKLSA